MDKLILSMPQMVKLAMMEQVIIKIAAQIKPKRLWKALILRRLKIT